MYNRSYENMSRDEQIVVCKYFIGKLFDDRDIDGVEASCFFKMTEEEGIYNGGYGEPISDALLDMCHIVTHIADNGSYLYTTFDLKEEYR